MCSHPMVHEAHPLRTTPVISDSCSLDNRGASAKVACWKLRVGKVLTALKASRLASVPSSRYLAVAGPNESLLSARAASTTPLGSDDGTLVAARTAIAFRPLAPITAPSPPL